MAHAGAVRSFEELRGSSSDEKAWRDVRVAWRIESSGEPGHAYVHVSMIHVKSCEDEIEKMCGRRCHREWALL